MRSAAIAVLLLATRASAQDAFKPVDDALREAETTVVMMESLGAPGEKPGCPPGVSMSVAVQDLANNKLPKMGQEALSNDRGGVVSHYVCRALAAGNSQPCASLRVLKMDVNFEGKADKKDLKRPETYEFLCVSGFTDLSIAKGGQTGNKAMVKQACMEHDKAGHRDFKPEMVDQACQTLADNFHNPQAVCGKVVQYFRTKVSQAYCVNELKMFSGDPAACASLGESDEKLICGAAAAFKSANASKKIESCGSSVLCKAMMGGGAGVCEPLGRAALGNACAAFYSPNYMSTEGKKLEASLDHVKKLLDSLDLSAQGPAAAKGIEDRIEKAVRLQHRAQQVAARFKPPQR